jgi:hypothetical protein
MNKIQAVQEKISTFSFFRYVVLERPESAVVWAKLLHLDPNSMNGTDPKQ